MTEFKMAAIIKLMWEGLSLSQIELVWVRVRVECRVFLSESEMEDIQGVCLHQVKSQKEWVWVRLNYFDSTWSEWSESVFEWIWEKIIKLCLNRRWQCLKFNMGQNSRWLPSSSWVRINVSEVWEESAKMDWNQDGRIQVDRIRRWLPSSSWVRMNERSFLCTKWLGREMWIRFFWPNSRWLNHHQVEWEWRSLSQIELVSIRGLFKMVESKMARIEKGCHHQVKSDWMSEVFCANGEEGRFKWRFFFEMVGTNLVASVSEFERKFQDGRIKDGQNSRWLPSSSWFRMNEWSLFCANGGESKMAELARWLPSSSLREKNYDGWILHGGIQVLSQSFEQDSCHHPS